MGIVWQEFKGLIADLYSQTTEGLRKVYAATPPATITLTMVGGTMTSLALIMIPFAALVSDAFKNLPDSHPLPLVIDPALGLVMFMAGVMLQLFTLALLGRIEKRMQGKPKDEPATEREA